MSIVTFNTPQVYAAAPRLQARHWDESYIHCSDDHSGPSRWLMEIGLKAAKDAMDLEIECIDSSLPDAKWFNVYPGEPYRFIKALTRHLKPQIVVEVGTFTGMGCMSFCQGNPSHPLDMHTFDLVPLSSLPSHVSERQVTQHLENLNDPAVFEKHRELLTRADIIFMDGPKDGRFEYGLWDKLKTLAHKPERILLMDDIRFKNMIPLWRSITQPKLDISSFGHWSGFGMVDLSL